MPVGGNALYSQPQLDEVVEVFPYLGIMLAIGEADKLRIAIFVVLVAQQAELLEVRGVNAKVDEVTLDYPDRGGFGEQRVKGRLQSVHG